MVTIRKAALGALTLLVAMGALAACGGDDDGDSGSATTTSLAGAGVEASTTRPDDGSSATDPSLGAEPLTILVTNDDGYEADGIAVLVDALADLNDVDIVVFAPLEQRSGSGGKSTEGDLAVSDVELTSGHPATAVAGFPVDAIRVAIDEQGVEPDLVVSGINEGQNLGPLVDVSGTVGAARAAVARGVPALAVSQGFEGFDYDSAIPLVLDWISERRQALADGSAALEVFNLNVPSCPSGAVRGVVKVEPDLAGDPGQALSVQDCTSTDPVGRGVLDVEAFVHGYATISVLPSEPATPPEVVPAA